MARSNFYPYAFVWEEGKTVDFSETNVVYDIKVGKCSQLNEYVKLMSTKDLHVACLWEKHQK